MVEGDHGSAYFYPDSEAAREAIRCQVELQRAAGGNAMIGRELYPLLTTAGFSEVQPQMLFMIVEHFRPGQARAVYRRFQKSGRMAPDGLRYLASWVDLDFRRCFQVMEAETAEDLKAWTANWEDLINFEIIPVRTSADAAATIAPEL